MSKTYVDASVANSGGGNFVSKAGDTMTGPLSLPAERSDIRRSDYDRLVNVIITTALSAAIAFHDKWWK